MPMSMQATEHTRAPDGPLTPGPSRAPLVSVRGVHRHYGSTHALDGVDLSVDPGEILGLVGHNGAGKSTLMRLIAGSEQPDAGDIAVHGAPEGAPWTAAAAEAAGVRMVYQELALCPDLTVTENAYLSDRRRTGVLWRRRAERRILQTLDTVFPGHGITICRRAGELAMAQRQMVEIARALCTDHLRLLILDEPTESLGSDAAAQLYEYLRARTADGMSALLISHRMHEVLAHSDRIAVMRDGVVVSVTPARDATEETLVTAMGGEVTADEDTLDRVTTGDEDVDAGPERPVIAALPPATGEPAFECRAGEIVGLAGLAGQGQEEVLRRLWEPATFRRATRVPRHRAYVPGDRQTSGILPLWNVAENLTIAAGRAIGRWGFINAKRKRELASTWVDTLQVRGGAAAPITALSGGNQQKVLIARAFAADAELVLLDDPFRGVDVRTKNELYALMKAEAARGRCIVWYSTENTEMAHCDRVYVFRSGHIVSELRGDAITEERIIADSFDETSEGGQ